MPRPKKYTTEEERLNGLKENKLKYRNKDEIKMKIKEYNKMYYQTHKVIKVEPVEDKTTL